MLALIIDGRGLRMRYLLQRAELSSIKVGGAAKSLKTNCFEIHRVQLDQRFNGRYPAGRCEKKRIGIFGSAEWRWCLVTRYLPGTTILRRNAIKIEGCEDTTLNILHNLENMICVCV